MARRVLVAAPHGRSSVTEPRASSHIGKPSGPTEPSQDLYVQDTHSDLRFIHSIFSACFPEPDSKKEQRGSEICGASRCLDDRADIKRGISHRAKNGVGHEMKADLARTGSWLEVALRRVNYLLLQVTQVLCLRRNASLAVWCIPGGDEPHRIF